MLACSQALALALIHKSSQAVISAWMPKSRPWTVTRRLCKCLIQAMNQPADLHPCNLDSGNPCRNDDVSSLVGLGFYWLSKKITLIKGSLDDFKMPLAGLFSSRIKNNAQATEIAQKTRIMVTVLLAGANRLKLVNKTMSQPTKTTRKGVGREDLACSAIARQALHSRITFNHTPVWRKPKGGENRVGLGSSAQAWDATSRPTRRVCPSWQQFPRRCAGTRCRSVRQLHEAVGLREVAPTITPPKVVVPLVGPPKAEGMQAQPSSNCAPEPSAAVGAVVMAAITPPVACVSLVQALYGSVGGLWQVR